jgi:hypothetical protein
MPQYLFGVHHDSTEPKMSPEREQQSYADTGAFNQKLINGGHFVFANGISEPSEAILVDNRNDEATITKEMYIKGSRYLGGFWVVTFDDDKTAQNWALEASRACHQPVEVRRFHS